MKMCVRNFFFVFRLHINCAIYKDINLNFYYTIENFIKNITKCPSYFCVISCTSLELSLYFCINSMLFPILPWYFLYTSGTSVVLSVGVLPDYFHWTLVLPNFCASHSDSLVSLSYTMPAFSANSFALFGLELYEGIG